MLLSSACVGDISGIGKNSAGNSSARKTSPLCIEKTAPAPGASPLRRLTRFEYDNTIRDLLGDNSKPSSAFPPDEVALGFDNNAEARVVGTLLFEKYLAAAEQIAARAKANLTQLLPCNPALVGEDSCARQFIAAFGKKAWRRPLDESDLIAATKIFAWGKANHDFATGIELVIQMMLQSPRFLYRVELAPPGVGDPVIQVDGWEMASRLSYLIWGSLPDDDLFAAAQAGQLGTAAELSSQAARMIKDPRTRGVVSHFHSQWLELEKLDTLEKDTGIYPAFKPALRDLFKQETERFVDHVFWDGDGRFEKLFTAPFTFANAELAAFYGLPPPAGSAFVQVTLDPTKRAGLLTQGTFLATQAKANQTSPIHRGKFVREKLLCQFLPAPPDNIPDIPGVDPNATARERFAAHSREAACAGCHRLMDPIGFAFEQFDGIGQWRDRDNGKVIDLSGEIVEADPDVVGPFVGPLELGRKLAQSQQVHACVSRQWFRFAYGRSESPEDQCALEKMSKPLSQTGSLRDFLVALTQADAFRYRTVER